MRAAKGGEMKRNHVLVMTAAVGVLGASMLPLHAKAVADDRQEIVVVGGVAGYECRGVVANNEGRATVPRYAAAARSAKSFLAGSFVRMMRVNTPSTVPKGMRMHSKPATTRQKVREVRRFSFRPAAGLRFHDGLPLRRCPPSIRGRIEHLPASADGFAELFFQAAVLLMVGVPRGIEAVRLKLRHARVRPLRQHGHAWPRTV
jgi:hypothetical protein